MKKVNLKLKLDYIKRVVYKGSPFIYMTGIEVKINTILFSELDEQFYDILRSTIVNIAI